MDRQRYPEWKFLVDGDGGDEPENDVEAILRSIRHYPDAKEIVLIAVLFGAVSTVFDFVFFAIFRPLGPGGLQTNWFVGSVLTELVLIFSVRTNRFFLSGKRPAFLLTVLCALAFVGAIILPFIPFAQGVFSFMRPNTHSLILLLSIVGGYFVVNEVFKALYYRRARPAG